MTPFDIFLVERRERVKEFPWTLQPQKRAKTLRLRKTFLMVGKEGLAILMTARQENEA